MDGRDKEGPSWSRAPFRGGAGGAGERAEVAVAWDGPRLRTGVGLRGPQGGSISAASSIRRNVQDRTPGERVPSGTLHHLLLGREAKVSVLQNGFITG